MFFGGFEPQDFSQECSKCCTNQAKVGVRITRLVAKVLNMLHETGRSRSEKRTDQASLSGPCPTIFVSQICRKQYATFQYLG